MTHPNKTEQFERLHRFEQLGKYEGILTQKHELVQKLITYRHPDYLYSLLIKFHNDGDKANKYLVEYLDTERKIKFLESRLQELISFDNFDYDKEFSELYPKLKFTEEQLDNINKYMTAGAFPKVPMPSDRNRTPIK